MPRYYFNVYNGVVSPDDVGTDLSDWKTARIEAIRLAGRMLEDDAQVLTLGTEWRLEVVDAQGLLLLQLDFHVTESPILRDDSGQSI